MLTHAEQKELPYSAEQMFDLVADVGCYEEFLPWCIKSRINEREACGRVFYADLIVGYKMFREKFSSRVVTDSPTEIYIEYLKGPLKNLKNKWVFTDKAGGGCIVDFQVEFEFRNKALQSLATLFFNEVVKRMTDAFEERAGEVYGT